MPWPRARVAHEPYWSISLMSDAAQPLSRKRTTALRNRAQTARHGRCRAFRATTADLYQALSQVAREQLAQRWVNTQNTDRDNKARRIYYLSMEFLIGRAMNNALSAIGLRDQAAAVFTRRARRSTR
jgi:glucan phosphorylase